MLNPHHNAMSKSPETFLSEIGIWTQRPFKHAFDRAFFAALAAGSCCLVLLNIVDPDWNDGMRLHAGLILSMVVWRPLIEELLFRGVVQGQLAKLEWATLRFYGISGANAITSLLFAAVHLLDHPLPWAAAVIGPSLVFGYFRDRHGYILASVLLHSTYNASYLWLGVCLH
jgi:membrane protease YdiL (CAAX protease family)